jgi:hypothetical protein
MRTSQSRRQCTTSQSRHPNPVPRPDHSTSAFARPLHLRLGSSASQRLMSPRPLRIPAPDAAPAAPPSPPAAPPLPRPLYPQPLCLCIFDTTLRDEEQSSGATMTRVRSSSSRSSSPASVSASPRWPPCTPTWPGWRSGGGGSSFAHGPSLPMFECGQGCEHLGLSGTAPFLQSDGSIPKNGHWFGAPVGYHISHLQYRFFYPF